MDDLLQPFILGQPEPLTDTVPPQQLADPDSRWIEVGLLDAIYFSACTGQEPPFDAEFGCAVVPVLADAIYGYMHALPRATLWHCSMAVLWVPAPGGRGQPALQGLWAQDPRRAGRATPARLQRVHLQLVRPSLRMVQPSCTSCLPAASSPVRRCTWKHMQALPAGLTAAHTVTCSAALLLLCHACQQPCTILQSHSRTCAARRANTRAHGHLCRCAVAAVASLACVPAALCSAAPGARACAARQD